MAIEDTKDTDAGLAVPGPNTTDTSAAPSNKSTMEEKSVDQRSLSDRGEEQGEKLEPTSSAVSTKTEWAKLAAIITALVLSVFLVSRTHSHRRSFGSQLSPRRLPWI